MLGIDWEIILEPAFDNNIESAPYKSATNCSRRERKNIGLKKKGRW